MGLLGFSSVYREGVEVVLFLQSYRLRLGDEPVFLGVLLGAVLAGIVAVLTFIAHRKLPYRKMLILTGVLLGLVLVVMVGEQTQEMQLARWLPTTPLHLAQRTSARMDGVVVLGVSTVETLTAQAIALILVLGSYFMAERSKAGSR